MNHSNTGEASELHIEMCGRSGTGKERHGGTGSSYYSATNRVTEKKTFLLSKSQFPLKNEDSLVFFQL